MNDFSNLSSFTHRLAAGWSSPVARQAHNLKVAGSNPAPAPKHYLTPGREALIYGNPMAPSRGVSCVSGLPSASKAARLPCTSNWNLPIHLAAEHGRAVGVLDAAHIRERG